jgi:hypothetical protein
MTLLRQNIGAILIAIVLLGTGVVGAILFRYEPMNSPNENEPYVSVWDRWEGRVCISPRPMPTNVSGTACNAQEKDAMLKGLNNALAAR